jgi:hypothetical protein
MKRIFMFFLLVVPAYLLAALAVSADPRMETNKNFCHFILDPDNTDNEIFMAGCDSVITVVEKAANATHAQIQCNENAVASGYATVKKVVPLAAAPLPTGETSVLTSDMSDTPCTMVESNGRAYQSKKWQSTIKVDPGKKGFVTVSFELFCQDGHQ